MRAPESLRRAWNEHWMYTLVLAPTGSSTDAVQALYSGAGTGLLQKATEIHNLSAEPGSRATFASPAWSLRRVGLTRTIVRDFRLDPEAFLDGVVVESDCVVQLQRCLVSREAGGDPEPRGPAPFYVDGDQGIVAWFSEALQRGRELALSLGAHGDLCVVFSVQTIGRFIFYADSRGEEAKSNFQVSYWSSVDADAVRDASLMEQLRKDLLRDLGIPPGAGGIA